MVKIVSVGLCHLRTFVGTYEQFISVLWNNFFNWECSEVFMELRPGNKTYLEWLGIQASSR